MSCPSELTLMTYADGELPRDSRAATEAHLAACHRCRERVRALRAETGLVAAALTAEVPVAVPPFTPPASRPAVAAGAFAFVLAATLIAAAPDFVNFSLPAPFTWFETFDVVSLADLAVRVGLFLVERGGVIMTGILELAALASVIGVVAWLTSALRRRRHGPLLLVVLVCACAALPPPAEALDIRRAQNGNILVAADEVIEDSLIAMGETVEVDGTVEGDLIAFGRRVVIRGRVDGMVMIAAQTITLDGEVGGSVLGFGQTLNVAPTRIGRNLYGFGAAINGSQRTTVGQNAVVFAERANLAGPVGRDVLAFAEEIELGSVVGGGLIAYADRVTLLAPARVAGNVTAHVPAEDHMTVSPGATIDGQVVVDVRAEEEEQSEYTTGGYYVAQVLRFAAALLVGLILLALVPRLRRASLDSAGEALAAGAVGLVTLVAVPIVALIVAVTIIGIPVAIIAVLLWLVALYLAKIVLAHFLGARLLQAADNPRSFAVALVVGLLLIMIAVNLPFIGGVLNFLLTICGLGLLVLFGWQAFRRQPREVPV